MIVFTAPFVLSEASAGRPLTHARIGWQTHIRDRALGAAAVTVSSEDPDGPRDAPLRPDTAEYWQPSALPATWQVDLGASLDFDYVGLARHSIGSSACSLLVETSPDALVWTTFAAALAPADDAPILLLDASRSARHVRLTLSGAGAIPKLAVVYVGQILAMYRPVYAGQVPVPIGRQTSLTQMLTRGGQFLGQSYRRLGVKGTAGPFKNLDPAWVRESFEPFAKNARKYPYFYAWRPQTYPLEVGFVWTDKDIAAKNSGKRELMDVAWPYQGVGNE